MELHWSELVPRSATPARRFRLRHFLQPHHFAVKMFRRLFKRLRYSDVDVINGGVHLFSELCEKPDAESNCFSRSATPPGCAFRYALNCAERLRGMLSEFHCVERKCLARKTIWPM